MDYPVNFSNSKDSTETFLNELVKHPAMSAIMNTAKNEEQSYKHKNKANS